ncbi:hypothetical protein KC19_11G153400 [Ceratodon purpureus]|uniref:Uncharacterized protein n=1 Tax=Ceratodon purpureus TaxID=3225 RepID=A0A8T0GJ18_CERPU|nr:hypothetical protein KC19_11G153400 [Ceratodon purpureus]
MASIVAEKSCHFLQCGMNSLVTFLSKPNGNRLWKFTDRRCISPRSEWATGFFFPKKSSPLMPFQFLENVSNLFREKTSGASSSTSRISGVECIQGYLLLFFEPQTLCKQLLGFIMCDVIFSFRVYRTVDETLSD